MLKALPELGHFYSVPMVEAPESGFLWHQLDHAWATGDLQLHFSSTGHLLSTKLQLIGLIEDTVIVFLPCCLIAVSVGYSAGKQIARLHAQESEAIQVSSSSAAAENDETSSAESTGARSKSGLAPTAASEISATGSQIR